MLIEILGETIEFPNRTDVVPEIIQTVEEKLGQAGFYYSHVNVDGVKFYDELEAFLQENISAAGRIKVVGCTLKELADGVILSSVEYLNGAVPALTELASKFYREPDAGCWQQLADLFDGVQWLMDSFSLIDREVNASPQVQMYSNWDDYLGKIYSLKEVMEQLRQAMESGDTVLMGDILNYEVVDLFKQMEEALNNMLPWEG